MVLESKTVEEISLQRNISLFSYILAMEVSLIKSQVHFPIKRLSKCSAQELSLEAHKSLHLPLSHMQCQVEFLFFNDFILVSKKKKKKGEKGNKKKKLSGKKKRVHSKNQISCLPKKASLSLLLIIC